MGLVDTFLGSGREPGTATLAVRGASALLATAVVVGLLLMQGRGEFADRLRTTAVLDDAGGSLVVGSDVKYDGVIVGRVAALATTRDVADADHGVRLSLDLDPEAAAEVPANVVARVLPASVFGTSYLDLTTHSSATGTLADGDRIPQDRTAGTLEMQAVLDGLDTVVDSLGPARLATALEGFAGALDGNGEALGRSIETLHRYVGRLNPELPVLRRNLALLATNLEAFERYAPELLTAIDDSLVAARTLHDHEREFGELATSGSRAFDATDDLLRAEEQRLVDFMVRTAVVIDVLHDERSQLVGGVLDTVELARRFSEALGHGRYLRIDGDLQLNEERGYGPGACPSYGELRGRGCR